MNGNRRQLKTEENNALVIDHQYPSPEALQELTQSIIQEFNEVYSGEKRRFYYEKLNDQIARFTLIGPLKYVLSFGAWIENQF